MASLKKAMKKNTIILIVVALLAAGGAYYFFFTGTGNEPPLSAIPESSQAQMQFESLSNKLPTSLNAAIFSDPHFTALIDITQPIQQEPSGRIDPLAPIPGVAVTQ